MAKSTLHTFNIPVMGLGFTIDTPLKVARFGISSVISIIEDELIEQMRKFHSRQAGEDFVPITNNEDDYRARRITEYLNLVDKLVKQQIEMVRNLPFSPESDIVKYFELLPDDSPIKQLYNEMLAETDGNTKQYLQQQLRSKIVAGSIDVNVMSKVDKTNYTKDGVALPNEFSDALTSLRGYATSTLNSSVEFSAGYNPRLYAYIENFGDFFPDENENLKKKIILKVSDFRSSLTQGKILAKKGLWVSEFRIESGLNCGGHAFPTEGLLLGPILEEFKLNRAALAAELLEMCNSALIAKGLNPFSAVPEMRIRVQGGIGTANENKFLLEYYQADSTGWGSPFLLVPEATNVDDETLQQLATAKKEDYYLSDTSPLGVPFNNFRKTSSEKQRKKRIEKGRPGSACYKKYLLSNTEFTEIPICTASRQYQHLKINQLKEKNLPDELFEVEMNNITVKDCLCEGLGAAALLKQNINPAHNLRAVAICPGPNLAYFSGVFSLKQMVDHIYGRISVLNSVKRSNMFVNELNLYVDYLKDELEKHIDCTIAKKARLLRTFQTNLFEGIEYYKNMVSSFKHETERYIDEMKEELGMIELSLRGLPIPVEAPKEKTFPFIKEY